MDKGATSHKKETPAELTSGKEVRDIKAHKDAPKQKGVSA